MALFGLNAQRAPDVACRPPVEARKGTAGHTKPDMHGGSRIKKIVIDAGHGGKDSGAVGKSYKEKHITLAIALETGRQIKEAHPDIEVVYTRDSDVFVELYERARIANNSRADLFISIHCNSLPSRRPHQGTETYVLGMHVKNENLEVARRENAVMLLEENYKENYNGFDPNSSEGFIMSSMNQRAYVDRSVMLASLCEQQFAQAGRASHGVKQAGFWVLREIAMPSILIETGFLSSDNEETYLGSDEGQLNLATSIAQAFHNYRQLVERTNEAAPVSSQATPLPAKKPEVVRSDAQPASKQTSPVADKPVYQPTTRPTQQVGQAMPANKPAPAENGTVYRVQLAALKSMVNTQTGTWAAVSKLIVVQEDGWFRYYAGPYTSRAEADLAVAELRKSGFEQAFIVVFVDGKRFVAGR